MNPDRATLNFLNSFPEESRKRGDMLQKDGAVTQIFGNHLFIQGRVEDESGTHRTSLRLQGNRWFGSCTAEDDLVSGACQYATMMERMHRGEDLPPRPERADPVGTVELVAREHVEIGAERRNVERTVRRAAELLLQGAAWGLNIYLSCQVNLV
jgi:hypothetical protein